MRGVVVGAVFSLLAAVLQIGVGGIIPPPPPGEVARNALPVAPVTPPPVAGIAEPCLAKHPFPDGKTLPQVHAQMQRVFGLQLTGDGWTNPRFRPLVKIVWQSLDGINCTPFMAQIKAKNDGKLRLHAGPTRSWAWGDYGLTRPGAVTLDFAKMITAHQQGDDGRITRLLIHELTHVLHKDRNAAPAYWKSFQKLHRAEGRFSDYGYGSSEVMAEVVGYYVARCAKDNPYDSADQDAYYAWAKKWVFNDVEFGPAPGTKPSC
ncbi:hypothetical protein [Aestuariimicrobium ganziense]|uniref:hypothetical protein n=1 Tax=Aestuariimicrobium ganziense TaxID=2773677 RepID=UPI00194425CF|nr:hypothetical protein [Aestuariimicrobium ganziense]